MTRSRRLDSFFFFLISLIDSLDMIRHFNVVYHPGGDPGANPKSISLRYYIWEVAYEWESTKESSICPWVACRVVFKKTWFDRQDPRSVLSYAALLASSLPTRRTNDIFC